MTQKARPSGFEPGLDYKDLTDFSARLRAAFTGTRSLAEMRYPAITRTAELLCSKEPAKYARLVMRLMDGQSIGEIARGEKVREELLRCMRLLHPEVVAAGRAEILSNLEEVSVCFTRRLLKEHKDIGIEKVPQALSTVIEKLALLSGGATHRIEHANVPSAEALKRMFEELPSPSRVSEPVQSQSE